MLKPPFATPASSLRMASASAFVKTVKLSLILFLRSFKSITIQKIEKEIKLKKEQQKKKKKVEKNIHL